MIRLARGVKCGFLGASGFAAAARSSARAFWAEPSSPARARYPNPQPAVFNMVRRDVTKGDFSDIFMAPRLNLINVQTRTRRRHRAIAQNLPMLLLWHFSDQAVFQRPLVACHLRHRPESRPS